MLNLQKTHTGGQASASVMYMKIHLVRDADKSRAATTPFHAGDSLRLEIRRPAGTTPDRTASSKVQSTECGDYIAYVARSTHVRFVRLLRLLKILKRATDEVSRPGRSATA